MKYLLLINHGDAPTPYEEAWGSLSEDERNQIAARVPAARLGGAVEIRPVAEW